jgi:hypothetical protein
MWWGTVPAISLERATGCQARLSARSRFPNIGGAPAALAAVTETSMGDIGGTVGRVRDGYVSGALSIGGGSGPLGSGG